MSNELSQALFTQWTALKGELGTALHSGDEGAFIISNAKVLQFAQANQIDLTKSVVQAGTGTPAPVPDLGFVKKGGWGSKEGTDPSKWKVINMKDPATQFKVVDSKGVNIAANFNTQAGAQAFIDKAKGSGGGTTPKPPPSPPTPPSGGGTAGVDQFGIKKIFPDKPGGIVETKATPEYKTRHYASGKPDEPTCELTINVPKDHAQDVEATAIVTLTGMSHNDTIDWKLRGPPHQDGGGKKWYCIDQETNGGHGKTLQVESPHPSMHDAGDKVTKYFSPPNISSSRFGWKGIAVNKGPKDVYIACWINVTPDDQNTWRKVFDVHDTGQIKEGSITPATGGCIQIRIDGIKGKPTFEKASVREIVYSEASAAAK